MFQQLHQTYQDIFILSNVPSLNPHSKSEEDFSEKRCN